MRILVIHRSDHEMISRVCSSTDEVLDLAADQLTAGERAPLESFLANAEPGQWWGHHDEFFAVRLRNVPAAPSAPSTTEQLLLDLLGAGFILQLEQRTTPHEEGGPPDKTFIVTATYGDIRMTTNSGTELPTAVLRVKNSLALTYG